MRSVYRGYDIEVTRQPTVPGDELVFYSIVRRSDKRICADGFAHEAERVVDQYRWCRALVDEVLDGDGDWN